ncbi:hypothetical protein KW797_00150 [Candidatus Parcubacteria bacterium]|nr:hypothetical protein [Candidatus Parcubacteria bacterium]
MEDRENLVTCDAELSTNLVWGFALNLNLARIVNLEDGILFFFNKTAVKKRGGH